MLELSSKSTKILSILDNKTSSILALSFASSHFAQDENKLEKTLLDEIEKIYFIDSVLLKNHLKNTKFIYNNDEKEKIYLGTEAANIGQLQIDLMRVSLPNSKAFLYKIKPITSIEN